MSLSLFSAFKRTKPVHRVQPSSQTLATQIRSVSREIDRLLAPYRSELTVWVQEYKGYR